MLKLLLNYSDKVDVELINAVNNGVTRAIKFSTNKLITERDRKNQQNIKSIKNVKMVFPLKNKEGCLIFRGNLQCYFSPPYGGQFYVLNAIVDESIHFKDVKGVEEEVQFTTSPMNIDNMMGYLNLLKDNPVFVFNLNQFDDFMEIFEYYMKLSEELNNSASYPIQSISRPYFYLPVEEKGIYASDGDLLEMYKSLDLVKDENDLLKGYIVDEYTYELLNNELKESVLELVDINLNFEKEIMIKIKKMINDVYVSDFQQVTERNSKQLQSLSIINLNHTKKELIVTVESLDNLNPKYVNLYDMGQKVKVESINNSLRLIHQGNTGSAIELIKYLIGEDKMPNKTRSVVSKVKKNYLAGLNDSQKQAFLKAVDGSPVTLIKGPPGTGKTHVINAITQYITKELKEKVVISSQTHIAIDNVLDKLMSNYDLVIPHRITNRRNKYSEQYIDRTLYKTWATKIHDHIDRAKNKTLAKQVLSDLEKFKGDKSFQYSQNVGDDYSVIGATTTTSAIGGKKGNELLKDYKWLIIDEVSKCPITEVLRYLPYVEKIIMVGDDYQLAPLLEFTKEEVKDLPSYDKEKYEQLEVVYQKSVFADTIDKAEKSGRLVLLDENYRSTKDILDTYNVFYDNKLINKREETNPNKVKFSDKLPLFNDHDVFFVNVKNGKEITERKTMSRYNVEELEATRYVLEDLVNQTLHPSTVSVAAIFPYGEQISRFTTRYKDLINKAKRIFKSFDVDTVDAFQGKESDIVLVNTVVTDSSKGNFLNDFRRINVSMSRAKDKLIVFGNPITLSRIQMKVSDGEKRKYFKEIIGIIRGRGKQIDFINGGINYEVKRKNKIEV